MLNEANKVYEEAGRKYAMESEQEFTIKRLDQEEEDMRKFINPAYLKDQN